MGRIRSFDLENVLEHAMDTFWEWGYEGAGMQEICRVTGLNPGSLYAAFGDKHGLFIEALKRYMTAASRETIERLNSTPSGRTGITNYYAALVDSMLDGKRRWGCLVTNSIVEFAMSDPQISEVFQLHLARLETALSGAVERAKRAGELVGDVNASEAAAFLVCTTQGLNVLAKTRPNRSTLEAITRHAFVAVGFKP
ncbi:TetR/AcrR family transcriptional regulator [Salmonella enterica]|nr:TetR/AcrR family transcriptional regulator [Salmonella enterica]EAW9909092.1 TetR/AcrR family transcriptional regulator [Salmonella enterica]